MRLGDLGDEFARHEGVRLECIKIAADRCGDDGPEATVAAAAKLVAFVIGGVEVQAEPKRADLNPQLNGVAGHYGQAMAGMQAPSWNESNVGIPGGMRPLTAPEQKPKLSEAGRIAIINRRNRLWSDREVLFGKIKRASDDLQPIQADLDKVEQEMRALDIDLGITGT